MAHSDSVLDRRMEFNGEPVTLTSATRSKSQRSTRLWTEPPANAPMRDRQKPIPFNLLDRRQSSIPQPAVNHAGQSSILAPNREDKVHGVVVKHRFGQLEKHVSVVAIAGTVAGQVGQPFSQTAV